MDGPAVNELLLASDFDASQEFEKDDVVIFSINFATYDAYH